MINWQAVEAIGVWAAGLMAFLNVLFFFRYLGTMRQTLDASVKQAKAASEQAEGLSRPIIVVKSERFLPKDEAEWLSDVVPSEIEGERVTLLNVGNGPALNIKWTYPLAQSRIIGAFPYLPFIGEFTLPFNPDNKERLIECEYSSPGGTRYMSTITLRFRYIIKTDLKVIAHN